jgi:hypothetical protein
MTPVENDVLRKLERANPVAGGEVSGSVKGGEARELLARVTASEAKTGAGRRRSWVRAGVPAMTATVVIALVAVSLIGGRRTEISPERGSGIEAPEGTPEPLQRIAAVAATQPEVLLPEGGFRYTKSENRYLSVSILSENRFYSVMQPAIREI